MRLQVCFSLLLLFISTFAFGQMTHDIKNDRGKVQGQFEVVVFVVKNGKPDTKGDLNPEINILDSETGRFGLRLRALKWKAKAKKFDNKEVKIKAEGVRISATTGINRIGSGLKEWVLKPGRKEYVDIEFSSNTSEELRVVTITLQYSVDGKLAGEVKRSVTLLANKKALPEAPEVINIPAVTKKTVPQKETASPSPVVTNESKEEDADLTADLTWKKIPKNSPRDLLNFAKTFASYDNDNAKAYVKEALNLYEELESAAWKKAKRQKRYNKYIKNFPTGKHIGTAKRLYAKIDKSKDKSPEEKAWNLVEKTPTEESLQAFLTEYPDGTFSEDAKEMLVKDLPITYDIINESNNANNEKVFILQFSNVSLPRLLDRHTSPQIEIDDSSFKKNHQLKVIFKGISEYSFIVEDVNFKKNVTVSLDNNFIVALSEDETGAYTFNIKKGSPPYRIDFLKPDIDIAPVSERFTNVKPNENGNFTITTEQMLEKGMNGTYSRVQVWDAAVNKNIEKSVTIDVSQSPALSFLYIILPLALLSLIALYMFKNRQKRIEVQEQYEKHQHKMEETPEDNKKVENKPQGAAKEPDNKNKLQIRKAKRVSTPDAPPPDKTKDITSGKIKMKWRKENNGLMSLDEFTLVTSNPGYYQKQLTEHWDNTEISDVFLGKDCIVDLGNFLREENLNRVVEEQLGMIPEIGGFLLGNYSFDEGIKKYLVSINRFIPFVPEYSDLYKIEIGTDTLVKELADAQDLNPNMSVIGWFHTHPGHGLFLSKPDLAVQRHFPQPYQLAMEIDSVTTRLDTAFFTRQSDGRMNNSTDRKTKNWFAWTNIDPSTKGRK